MYAKGRAAGFPPEVKRRIMIGTYALSAGYYDAYYKKAQKVRTLIRKDFDEAFARVDVLMTPTAPYLPFGIGEKSDDLLAMYAADVFVSPAALAGVPAISIPAGDVDGFSVGMQIIGNKLEESKVLGVAQIISRKS
jgi:aspartyl-tRNA(Asn)/glutamyl-tRNA(Gln) amidotransferase subunit A